MNTINTVKYLGAIILVATATHSMQAMHKPLQQRICGCSSSSCNPVVPKMAEQQEFLMELIHL